MPRDQRVSDSTKLVCFLVQFVGGVSTLALQPHKKETNPLIVVVLRLVSPDLSLSLHACVSAFLHTCMSFRLSVFGSTRRRYSHNYHASVVTFDTMLSHLKVLVYVCYMYVQYVFVSVTHTHHTSRTSIFTLCHTLLSTPATHTPSSSLHTCHSSLPPDSQSATPFILTHPSFTSHTLSPSHDVWQQFFFLVFQSADA